MTEGTKGLTESVLEHKYGPDVKEAFRHTTGIVGNYYEIKKLPEHVISEKLIDLAGNKKEVTMSQLD